MDSSQQQHNVGGPRHLSRMHDRLAAMPFLFFLVGALFIVLFICGTVVQIQTSEYLASGNPGKVAGVAWSIFAQPWLMVTGQAPVQFVTAWLYAWVVEATTLVFAFALSVAVNKINSLNPGFGRWFVGIGALLIGLNGWADYSASPGVNPLVQFLLALAIGMVVVIGLPLGVGLIEHGIKEL